MTTLPGMRRKRTASAIAAALALLTWIVLATSCSSTIAPTARITRSIDLNYAPPRVVVWAAPGQTEVRAAMQRAGILVESVREANLFVEVKMGSARGSGRCGTIHNVTYVIWHASAVVGTVRARGPIGDCPDNILDQMTRALIDLVQ